MEVEDMIRPFKLKMQVTCDSSTRHWGMIQLLRKFGSD